MACPRAPLVGRLSSRIQPVGSGVASLTGVSLGTIGGRNTSEIVVVDDGTAWSHIAEGGTILQGFPSIWPGTLRPSAYPVRLANGHIYTILIQYRLNTTQTIAGFGYIEVTVREDDEVVRHVFRGIGALFCSKGHSQEGCQSLAEAVVARGKWEGKPVSGPVLVETLRH